MAFIRNIPINTDKHRRYETSQTVEKCPTPVIPRLGHSICQRVTKRSKIKVKVSKSSVTALFDKLEFVLLIIGYHILPTQTLERHYPNNDMTTRLVF